MAAKYPRPYVFDLVAHRTLAIDEESQRYSRGRAVEVQHFDELVRHRLRDRAALE